MLRKREGEREAAGKAEAAEGEAAAGAEEAAEGKAAEAV